MVKADVPGSELIENVTRKRAGDAQREIRDLYPDATVSYEMAGDRGVITVCQDRYVVSKEFVESEASLTEPHMSEYARVLLGKSRLVVVVPKEKAVKIRMRFLEFNNWWLFYYQVHYYDEDGEIRHVDRRTWRRMMNLPPDEGESAPEVA